MHYQAALSFSCYITLVQCVMELDFRQEININIKHLIFNWKEEDVLSIWNCLITGALTVNKTKPTVIISVNEHLSTSTLSVNKNFPKLIDSIDLIWSSWLDQVNLNQEVRIKMKKKEVNNLIFDKLSWLSWLDQVSRTKLIGLMKN